MSVAASFRVNRRIANLPRPMHSEEAIGPGDRCIAILCPLYGHCWRLIGSKQLRPLKLSGVRLGGENSTRQSTA
jgi:hypothetical protein